VFCSKLSVPISKSSLPHFFAGMGFFYVEEESVFVAYWYDPEACRLFVFSRMGDKVGVTHGINVPLVNIVLMLFVLLPLVSCGEYPFALPHKESLQSDAMLRTDPSPELLLLLSKSDVVVLGSINACWVCQFDPEPQVVYTKILAGDVAQVEEEGPLLLGGIPRQFLPEGGVPIYRSQKEEICFLKKIVEARFQGAVTYYEVVDIWEARPENLSMFHDE